MPDRSRFPGGRIEDVDPDDGRRCAARDRGRGRAAARPGQRHRAARHLHNRHRLRDHADRRHRRSAGADCRSTRSRSPRRSRCRSPLSSTGATTSASSARCGAHNRAYFVLPYRGPQHLGRNGRHPGQFGRGAGGLSGAMLRVLLTIVLPLVLPTALYLAWIRTMQGAEGGAAALAGFAVGVACWSRGAAADRRARWSSMCISANRRLASMCRRAGRMAGSFPAISSRSGDRRAPVSGSEARTIAPQPWMTAPQTRAVIAALAEAGIAARFVGGCVRDALLGRADRRYRHRDAGAPGGGHRRARKSAGSRRCRPASSTARSPRS